MNTSNGIRLTASAAVCLLMLIAVPDPSNAQCQQLLKPHVDWIKNKSKGPGVYTVRLVVVSNGLAQLVRYGDATLTLNAASTALVGSAKVYKSEKTYPFGGGTAPFAPGQTDTWAVSINVNTGNVTLGNDIISAPQCTGGMIHGFGTKGTIFQSYYVLSLLDKFATVPS
jgi:hypothetical protein